MCHFCLGQLGPEEVKPVHVVDRESSPPHERPAVGGRIIQSGPLDVGLKFLQDSFGVSDS